jgi:hypothetical protein
MFHKLLIASVLAIPAATWAQDALDPDLVQQNETQTELQTVDRELAEARAELARLVELAESERLAAELAEEELLNTPSDRDPDEAGSGAAADTAWNEVERAREQLSAAKQACRVQKTELKLARQRGDQQDIARARSMLTSARKQVADSRAQIAAAEAQYRQIRPSQDGRTDPEETVASARLERSSAPDRRDLTSQEIELARARVEAIEAVRGRVMAEIEYERARKAGELQSLDMLKKALQDAREAEMHASARLKELEAS